MSQLTVSPHASPRPATITAAVGLLVALALLSIGAVLAGVGDFDPVFVTIAGTFAALKLVAAAGLWRCLRWAAILGFVATLLDTLLAVPGFFDGSSEGDEWVYVSAVVLGILALVMLALPASRRVYVR